MLREPGYNPCSTLSSTHAGRLFLSVVCAVTGVLKGYDPLMNLVLDETKEWLRDPFDPYKLTGTITVQLMHT